MLKRMAVLSVILVLLTSLTIFVGGSILVVRSGDKIYGGTIAGLPLGGLDRVQAGKILRETVIADGREIILLAGGRQWAIPLNSIGAYYDYQEAVANAYSVGRTGSFVRRVSELLGNKAEGAEIKLPLKADSQLLKKELERINGEYSVKPIDARLILEENEVTVVPEKEGIEMDLAGMMGLISDLKAGDELKLAIASNVIHPAIRQKDISGLTDILGECSTMFEAGPPGRVNNIVRASEKLDGKLVKPGEIFAFNGVVGPFDENNGYLNAPVIADDLRIDDYGGGICQVSTTLYGAALLSGFEIIERYPHTAPVEYVPPGHDATVSDGEKDLRFKNNLNQSVYIAATTDPDQGFIKVFIVGKKQNNIIFRISSELKTTSPGIIHRGNDRLWQGQSVVVSEGYPGFEVSVFRHSLAEDGEEKEELISHDIYLPEH